MQATSPYDSHGMSWHAMGLDRDSHADAGTIALGYLGKCSDSTDIFLRWITGAPGLRHLPRSPAPQSGDSAKTERPLEGRRHRIH